MSYMKFTEKQTLLDKRSVGVSEDVRHISNVTTNSFTENTETAKPPWNKKGSKPCPVCREVTGPSCSIAI